MKPLFPNVNTAIIAGILFLGAGYVCLWDAYKRRGRNAPAPLGAILPW
jgi:hypothetical protein